MNRETIKTWTLIAAVAALAAVVLIFGLRCESDVDKDAQNAYHAPPGHYGLIWQGH